MNQPVPVQERETTGEDMQQQAQPEPRYDAPELRQQLADVLGGDPEDYKPR